MKYTLLIEFDNELPEQVQQYYLDYNNTHEDDSGVDIVCPFRLAVSVFDVGIVVFLSIKGVFTPPRVSIPRVNGVTSSKSTSLVSPDKTDP